MTTPSTSLVITTYNRARLLCEALESIATSKVKNHESFEVIVVDNNSTDDTAATVAAFRKDFPFHLAYLRETKQGTSHARNAGIDAARGTYVAFMDDDQRIDPGYLDNIEPAFRASGAVCIGGPVRYYNARDIPRWLAPVIKHKGQLECGSEPRKLRMADQRLAGGNMVFERAAFHDIGLFDTRLGHHGHTLGGGEDWEIQDRAITQGKTVAYHPQLIQYHYLREERYHKHYWRKLYFAYGRSLYLRTDWRTANRLWGAPRSMWWSLVTRNIRRLATAWLVFDRAHRFERQLDIWLQVGQICEARKTRDSAARERPIHKSRR